MGKTYMPKKDDITIEKETIMKEVRGEKIEKTTFRIHIQSEGKLRSIVFTPAQFKKFQKEVSLIKN
jgi:hypothetical protein